MMLSIPGTSCAFSILPQIDSSLLKLAMLDWDGSSSFNRVEAGVCTCRSKKMQRQLPVKIVVFDNRVLGFVALEMKASGFLEIGTSLTNPDFAAMARAIGVHARRVEEPGELEEAIKDVFAHDGPALLDVVTNTQELAMPPSINLEQVRGFGLWAMQAVISGRGTELIDVARTNLLR